MPVVSSLHRYPCNGVSYTTDQQQYPNVPSIYHSKEYRNKALTPFPKNQKRRFHHRPVLNCYWEKYCPFRPRHLKNHLIFLLVCHMILVLSHHVSEQIQVADPECDWPLHIAAALHKPVHAEKL